MANILKQRAKMHITNELWYRKELELQFMLLKYLLMNNHAYNEMK